MPKLQVGRTPDFQPWALAVANVGTWHNSLTTERLRCDLVMADMFGLTEEEASEGVPLQRMREIAHPADRALFDRRNAGIRAGGGTFVSEYRIVPRPGVLRWVLVRGLYEVTGTPDAPEVTGHGIALDLTGIRAEAADDGKPYLTSDPREAAGPPLDRAADAALALHRAIDDLGPADAAGIREASDLILGLVGRRLAVRITRDGLN